MLYWNGIDHSMKIGENLRVVDKKLQVNNKQVCDSDYRGEYIIALHNDSNEKQLVNPKDRIAQLIIMPYISVNFIETDNLSKTDRGEGGFGSTGKN